MRLIVYSVAAWIGIEMLLLAVLFYVAVREERDRAGARALLLMDRTRRRTGRLSGLVPPDHRAA